MNSCSKDTFCVIGCHAIFMKHNLYCARLICVVHADFIYFSLGVVNCWHFMKLCDRNKRDICVKQPKHIDILRLV